MGVIYKRALFLSIPVWMLLLSGNAGAQAPDPDAEDRKVFFNGLGRTSIQQTRIGGDLLDTDSLSVENLTDGEFLLDLAVNAQPNDKNEVQAVLRMRNELGGFFGAGVAVEVRELWARGIIADIVRYRVGDMDVAMTPYTLFLPDEEGMVNEPEIFRPQKEVIYHEQFYTEDNKRRLQGGKLDFGLQFDRGLDDLDVSAFIARIRGTDFTTTPTRFFGGAQATLATLPMGSRGARGEMGFNLAYTWDDLQSGNATSGLRNSVYTLDFDLTLLDTDDLDVHVLGETGQSNLEFKEQEESRFKEDDTFLQAGTKVNLKEYGLGLSASFIDVGPDFFSMGAQSKRIGFARTKTFYNRVGNARNLRMPTLFDLGRDRALYTFQLSDRLMEYDPRFSNTQPYGQATPNRKGLHLGVDYTPAGAIIDAELGLWLLEEIRGQGTFELKKFRLLRALANLNVHQYLDWEKTFRLTLGIQNEQVMRDGEPVEEVDLSSNLLEVGVEAEAFNRFDVLLGAKYRSAKGTDYVPLIETFNDVKDFPAPFIADDTEALLGAGFRYRFKDGVYLTVQYQNFSFNQPEDAGKDYRLKQVFVLYSMSF